MFGGKCAVSLGNYADILVCSIFLSRAKTSCKLQISIYRKPSVHILAGTVNFLKVFFSSLSFFCVFFFPLGMKSSYSKQKFLVNCYSIFCRCYCSIHCVPYLCSVTVPFCVCQVFIFHCRWLLHSSCILLAALHCHDYPIITRGDCECMYDVHVLVVWACMCMALDESCRCRKVMIQVTNFSHTFYEGLFYTSVEVVNLESI